MHNLYTRLFRKLSPEEKKLSRAVRRVLDKSPRNIHLYVLAMTHTSVATENEKGVRASNERLEYLGDAVLGAVVADYLFKKYPYKNEGFLTDVRSKIVNRESLNNLAVKIGISQLVSFEGRIKEVTANQQTFKSIFGDAMEAFLGAIYLDFGFRFCKKFIVHQLLIPHFDLDTLADTTTNFKSLVIEWSQKNNRHLKFCIREVNKKTHGNQFKVVLLLDGNDIAKGVGFSKKKAEQNASQKACELLNLL